MPHGLDMARGRFQHFCHRVKQRPTYNTKSPKNGSCKEGVGAEGCHRILQVREGGPVTVRDPIFGDIKLRLLGKITRNVQCSHYAQHPSRRRLFQMPRGVLTQTSSLFQICGVPGNLPCTAAACGGALCRDSLGLRDCGGPNCSGALPLSSNAFRKAEETAVLLTNLTTQLREPENQVHISNLYLFDAMDGDGKQGGPLLGNTVHEHCPVRKSTVGLKPSKPRELCASHSTAVFAK